MAFVYMAAILENGLHHAIPNEAVKVIQKVFLCNRNIRVME